MTRSYPLILALAALVGVPAVQADPPAHAPAHGYHKKHPHDRHDDHDTKRLKAHKPDKHYTGKSGVVYADDYGISAGRCNRDKIGAVIGGVSGAVIGGQVADRDNRTVGMVVGGVVGAVVGRAIGESMDERDRACMGHALELGRPGVPVEWRHDGRAYFFTPQGDAGGGCRHADLRVDGGPPQRVLACPAGPGEWRFRRS